MDCLILRSDPELSLCNYCYRNFLFFVKQEKKVNVFEERNSEKEVKKENENNVKNKRLSGKSLNSKTSNVKDNPSEN